MATTGQLEKLTIQAFTDPSLSDEFKVDEFKVLINPESYGIEYTVEYEDGQGQGTSTTQQRFTLKAPEEISFEFLLDNTGIIDGNPTENIVEDITKLKDLLVDFHGDNHEPYHVKLVWGGELFKGRCSSLNITYKLFNPDGTPIRAMCKITIKQSLEEEERVATEDTTSPDLTHYYTVKQGDTLPLLCYRIYGSPGYYLQIAKVNKLINFQKLEAGTELLFPPISKTTTETDSTTSDS